jgi:hypothetical protein
MKQQKFFKFIAALHTCTKMRKKQILKIIIFTQSLLFNSLITSRLDFKVSFNTYKLSEWYKSIGFNLVTFNVDLYQEN